MPFARRNRSAQGHVFGRSRTSCRVQGLGKIVTFATVFSSKMMWWLAIERRLNAEFNYGKVLESKTTCLSARMRRLRMIDFQRASCTRSSLQTPSFAVEPPSGPTRPFCQALRLDLMHLLVRGPLSRARYLRMPRLSAIQPGLPVTSKLGRDQEP